MTNPTPPTEASLSAEQLAEQWAQTAVTQARRTMLVSSRRRMVEARLKRAKVTIATLTARVSALTDAIADRDRAIREHQETCPEYEEGATDIDGMPLMVHDSLRLWAEAEGEHNDMMREAGRRL